MTKPLIDPLCLCGHPHPCKTHGGYTAVYPVDTPTAASSAAQNELIRQLIENLLNLIANNTAYHLTLLEEVA